MAAQTDVSPRQRDVVDPDDGKQTALAEGCDNGKLCLSFGMTVAFHATIQNRNAANSAVLTTALNLDLPSQLNGAGNR